MEYNLSVNKNKIKAQVDTHENNKLVMVIGENRFDVNYNLISENRIHLQIDNQGNKKEVIAYIADQPDGKRVFINGNTYLIQEIDLIDQNNSKTKKQKHIADIITPPTPAVVTGIMVKIGDVVKKKEPVIIVSAMKMETTLVAPFDGKVTKINVDQGDKVMPGDVLIDIKKS